MIVAFIAGRVLLAAWIFTANRAEPCKDAFEPSSVDFCVHFCPAFFTRYVCFRRIKRGAAIDALMREEPTLCRGSHIAHPRCFALSQNSGQS